VLVQIPDHWIEKCLDFARRMVAHYSGPGVHNMPWSRDEMTDDQLRAWLASRKDVGLEIDIETCEIGRWPANANGDPYGIREMLGEEDHLEKGYTDKFNFVRSPDSNGWVCEGDLPVEKARAMYDRIHREWEAYAREHPDDPWVRAHRQIKRE
jgi:hypothetical protein